MNVLVGCEKSGVVRRAFHALGHHAWSCDLEPADDNSDWHLQENVLDVIDVAAPFGGEWDLAIFHPPCTYLSVSGLHWNKRISGRAQKTEEALEFVAQLLDANIARIALENPISCISSRIRKPDQIIQPYEFGHPESKKTCLWLKNLPLLRPTRVLPLPKCGYWSNQTPSGQNKLGPSPERAAIRAQTYEGIAAAMAAQWGGAVRRSAL